MAAYEKYQEKSSSAIDISSERNNLLEKNHFYDTY